MPKFSFFYWEFSWHVSLELAYIGWKLPALLLFIARHSQWKRLFFSRLSVNPSCSQWKSCIFAKQRPSEKQSFGRNPLIFNPVKCTGEYLVGMSNHLLLTKCFLGKSPYQGETLWWFPFVLLCLEYTPNFFLSKITLNVVILTYLNRNSKFFTFSEKS